MKFKLFNKTLSIKIKDYMKKNGLCFEQGNLNIWLLKLHSNLYRVEISVNGKRYVTNQYDRCSISTGKMIQEGLECLEKALTQEITDNFSYILSISDIYDFNPEFINYIKSYLFLDKLKQ